MDDEEAVERAEMLRQLKNEEEVLKIKERMEERQYIITFVKNADKIVYFLLGLPNKYPTGYFSPDVDINRKAFVDQEEMISDGS